MTDKRSPRNKSQCNSKTEYSNSSKTAFSLSATIVTFVLAFVLNGRKPDDTDGNYHVTAQDFQVPAVFAPKAKDEIEIPVTNEYAARQDNFDKLNLFQHESYTITGSRSLRGVDHLEKDQSEAAEIKNPQMQKMIGPDGIEFEAYVRADVSTFYGEAPGTRKEQKPRFTGQAGKFVNLYPHRVSLYWEGPNREEYFQGDINAWGSGGSASFPTHKFIMTMPNKPTEVLCRITVVPGTSVYYCDPYDFNNTEAAKDPSRGIIVSPSKPMDINVLSADKQEIYNAHKFNQQFGEMYKEFTGSDWLTLYPPIIPKHKIWNATQFGQTHTVKTSESHFHSKPSKVKQQLTIDEMRRDDSHDALAKDQSTKTSRALQEYRNSESLTLTLKAVSIEPRIFEIRNFLSDVEVDHILGIVKQRKLERSRTGSGDDGHISETRTSSTTWIPRKTDSIMNAIFLRVADALQISESMFRERNDNDAPVPDLDSPHVRISEDLQIVHYGIGEEYTAHHDFGYPKSIHQKETRAINLCMYLNDVVAGGETSFPRWRNGESGGPLNVKPEKGKAVIFYMITPDGNLDDLSQHAALPVIEGEKYFANLWISSY